MAEIKAVSQATGGQPASESGAFAEHLMGVLEEVVHGRVSGVVAGVEIAISALPWERVAKRIPGAVETAADTARISAPLAALTGAAETAWTDAKKVKEGRMTKTGAVVHTAINGSIGGGAAGAGAFVGGVVGSLIPVPVVGTLTGIAVGAGIGYWTERELHRFIDPRVKTWIR
jgi:hypothetical protein